MANKKKDKQTNFIYNKEMEEKFGAASEDINSGEYRYGDRTYANQRALQSFGQG